MASIRCKSCGYDNFPEARFCANCGSSLVTPIEQAVPTEEPAPPVVSAAYAGFWRRFGAMVIDVIAVWLISWALFSAISGRGGIPGMIFPFTFVLFGNLFPITWLYLWLFTGLKGQTPGKMLLSIKVVNAQGSIPGLGMAALREIPGKMVSSIIVYLGFLWVIWDGQKQGWHDKMAKTYVVSVEPRR